MQLSQITDAVRRNKKPVASIVAAVLAIVLGVAGYNLTNDQQEGIEDQVEQIIDNAGDGEQE